MNDDFDLIEDGHPPFVYQMERRWKCRAHRLGMGWGGLWAMTRDGREAAAFMALGGLTAEAWRAARALMQISGKPLIVAVDGKGYTRITDPSSEAVPALGDLRPV